MSPLLRWTFAAFLGSGVSLGAVPSTLDEPVCMMQMVTLVDDSVDPHGNKELPVKDDENETHKESADCPRHAIINGYNVTFSHVVTSRGWPELTYTLIPRSTNKLELSEIAFTFPDCHCYMFMGMDMFEYTVSNPMGSSMDFKISCDGGMVLTLYEIGCDMTNSTYELKLTLMDPTFLIHDVKMEVATGKRRSHHAIAGPICNPGEYKPPAQKPKPKPSAPTAAPTTASGVPGVEHSPSINPEYSPAMAPAIAPAIAAAPAVAPAISPAIQDATTTFGDPHVGNLRGDKFDILKPDEYAFLVIPRGADRNKALLHVSAKVDRPEPWCNGELYITAVAFHGTWLGDMGSFNMSTTVDAGMDAQKAVKLQVGARPAMSVSELEKALPAGLVEVTVYTPEEPRFLWDHSVTLMVRLKLGPCVSKVRMVYEKEKAHFSNSLWLTTTGLRHVKEEIGGILGLDDHDEAMKVPDDCKNGSKGDTMRPVSGHGIRALASLNDED